ncbi:MAG: serine/threonine-protein kinase, partial [Acidobacteriota bacterium]
DAELAAEVRALLAVETGLVGRKVAGAVGELLEDTIDPADIDQVTALRFGPYRAVEPLGVGGMGAVYLGERVDADFDQRVALKIIGRGLVSEAVRRRFREERRILARLQHDSIARLIDGGVADDGQTLWLAMEPVEGRPLGEEALAGVPLAGRLDSFLALCDAVQYAHRHLIVHRDLKPSNILVDGEGRIKLLDFGIAKVLAGDESPRPGASSEVDVQALTPAYAAPEQIRGAAVTTATDIYLLGIVLYQMLTGLHPFDGERRAGALEAAILRSEPEPPSRALARRPESCPDVDPRRLSGDLDHICKKALHREPEQRYATVSDLAADVRRALDHRPVLAGPRTAGDAVRKW